MKNLIFYDILKYFSDFWDTLYNDGTVDACEFYQIGDRNKTTNNIVLLTTIFYCLPE